VADKYIYFDDAAKKKKEKEASDTSAGAGDAGKIVALNVNGLIDDSMLPTSDSTSYPTTENLAAGNLVNVFDNGGTTSLRKADNSNGRQAHGYVKVGSSSPAANTIYRDGVNENASGLTVGDPVFLGVSGAPTQDPNVGSGNILQQVGVAESATSYAFEQGECIERA
jgi:hypothetical protein